jgi:hypothetical protein
VTIKHKINKAWKPRLNIENIFLGSFLYINAIQHIFPEISSSVLYRVNFVDLRPQPTLLARGCVSGLLYWLAVCISPSPPPLGDQEG